MGCTVFKLYSSFFYGLSAYILRNALSFRWYRVENLRIGADLELG